MAVRREQCLISEKAAGVVCDEVDRTGQFQPDVGTTVTPAGHLQFKTIAAVACLFSWGQQKDLVGTDHELDVARVLTWDIHHRVAELDPCLR